MNIFHEIKSMISVRQVAESYGLKVNRNGMACCPFHNDKHPSMKIDSSH
ncbi:MAG: CHC2 zinc finger domain-containing protein, partial [Roseburia sp.]|nr:CHC2 zinc finger domain-containing protein [Roseburia sp.]